MFDRASASLTVTSRVEYTSLLSRVFAFAIADCRRGWTGLGAVIVSDSADGLLVWRP